MTDDQEFRIAAAAGELESALTASGELLYVSVDAIDVTSLGDKGKRRYVYNIRIVEMAESTIYPRVQCP